MHVVWIGQKHLVHRITQVRPVIRDNHDGSFIFAPGKKKQQRALFDELVSDVFDSGASGLEDWIDMLRQYTLNHGVVYFDFNKRTGDIDTTMKVIDPTIDPPDSRAPGLIGCPLYKSHCIEECRKKQGIKDQVAKAKIQAEAEKLNLAKYMEQRKTTTGTGSVTANAGAVATPPTPAPPTHPNLAGPPTPHPTTHDRMLAEQYAYHQRQQMERARMMHMQTQAPMHPQHQYYLQQQYLQQQQLLMAGRYVHPIPQMPLLSTPIPPTAPTIAWRAPDLSSPIPISTSAVTSTGMRRPPRRFGDRVGDYPPNYFAVPRSAPATSQLPVRPAIVYPMVHDHRMNEKEHRLDIHHIDATTIAQGQSRSRWSDISSGSSVSGRSGAGYGSDRSGARSGSGFVHNNTNMINDVKNTVNSRSRSRSRDYGGINTPGSDHAGEQRGEQGSRAHSRSPSRSGIIGNPNSASSNGVIGSYNNNNNNNNRSHISGRSSKSGNYNSGSKSSMTNTWGSNWEPPASAALNAKNESELKFPKRFNYAEVTYKDYHDLNIDKSSDFGHDVGEPNILSGMRKVTQPVRETGPTNMHTDARVAPSH